MFSNSADQPIQNCRFSDRTKKQIHEFDKKMNEKRGRLLKECDMPLGTAKDVIIDSSHVEEPGIVYSDGQKFNSEYDLRRIIGGKVR